MREVTPRKEPQQRSEQPCSYNPRISSPRSARTAAIWATSASDGFASAMWRATYLSAARSYFGSPLALLEGERHLCSDECSYSWWTVDLDCSPGC